MDSITLIEKYKKLVYKESKKYSRKLKPDGLLTIDDIKNMGFVGLLEAASRYNNEELDKFASFAFYRIRGNIIDEVDKILQTDKKKKNGITFVNIEDEQIDNAICCENSVVQDLYKKELLEIIDHIVEEECTEREKQVINLKYKSGMKNKDIAKELKLSEGRVSNICNKSIRKIKEKIKEKKIPCMV
jgi:RNA polymerase sigma factor for flagellar operon FliA